MSAATDARAGSPTLEARYSEEGVLAGRFDSRSDAEQLGDLLENGVGATFDLRAWSIRARECSSVGGPRGRLALLLEPCRADVAKWIAMQALNRDGTRAAIRDQCVYAEIKPESMDAIFAEHAPYFQKLPARTFWDLGSGVGKNVFLAAVTERFDRTVGIEILPELSIVADILRESFQEDVVCGNVAAAAVVVEFRTASFLEDLEWVTKAGCVYCNTIMFEEPLMAALATHARGMQPGSIFITLGQDLLGYYDEPAGDIPFEILESFLTQHSFGGGGVDTFVHRKI